MYRHTKWILSTNSTVRLHIWSDVLIRLDDVNNSITLFLLTAKYRPVSFDTFHSLSYPVVIEFCLNPFDCAFHQFRSPSLAPVFGVCAHCFQAMGDVQPRSFGDFCDKHLYYTGFWLAWIMAAANQYQPSRQGYQGIMAMRMLGGPRGPPTSWLMREKSMVITAFLTVFPLTGLFGRYLWGGGELDGGWWLSMYMGRLCIWGGVPLLFLVNFTIPIPCSEQANDL